MIVKFGRFGWKALLIWMECVAIVVGLALLGGIVFSWRLGTGAVDISFARETIEQALQDPVSGYGVGMDEIHLEWPNLSKPIVLSLDDVRLVRSGKEIVKVGMVELGISPAFLLRGRIKPVTISLERSSVHLIRTEDNRVVLSLEDTPMAFPEMEGEENPLMRMINMLAEPVGKVDTRSPVDRLKSLEIKDATLIMEDHVLGISWYLQNMSLVFARTKEGLSVETTMSFPGGRLGDSPVHANVIYDRTAREFSVSADVADFNPFNILRKMETRLPLEGRDLYINGDLRFTMDENMKILDADGIMQAENGQISVPGIYEQKPLEFQRLALDVSYDAAGQTLDLREAALRAYDVDLKVRGMVSVTPDKITAPLEITIPSLPQEKIQYLWPEVMHGKSIETWLLHRLSKGTIDNIATGLTVTAVKEGEGWTSDVAGITSSFDIREMTVNYSPPLTPATNTSGHGVLENDVLKIAIEKASVADMSVSGGSVIIDNIIAHKIGTAAIRVPLTASLPSLLKYVQSEPISMDADKLGLDPGNVKGDLDMVVEVSFPTIKDLPKEDVKVNASGTVTNVLLPDVVKTLDLTGGPMKLTVTQDKALLSGKGKLEGRSVTLDWEQFFESEGHPYSSKIKADMDADRGLRERLNIGLDDWIEGTVPVHVDYTEFNGGRGEVNVSGDLTPATVMVKPFEYAKPPGQAGTVTCKAILQNGFVTDIKNLEVKTPDLDVRNGSMKFGVRAGANDLRSGNFSRIVLGQTDATLDFEIPAPGVLKVGMKGAFFDARPFLKKKRKKGPYDGPAVLASLDVAKMRSSDMHVIDRVKIYMDLNKAGLVDQLELDGVAGKGAVYMRLKPDKARNVTTFRLEADDAGAALKSFDVYKNIKGGKITLVGESVPGKSPYAIFGHAQLADFNVVNAPTLAVLVSAISPTGLPMLLSNEGLYFSRLESRFEWFMRQPGDIYMITDGRTSGSSLGLTFEGKIDKEAGRVDVKGHVVPMSEINSLISNIPILGQILTGGSEGGVFAATYTMRGPIEKPEVSINPLSVLAPGIIRRILFED